MGFFILPSITALKNNHLSIKLRAHAHFDPVYQGRQHTLRPYLGFNLAPHKEGFDL
jgi:hypothetical protein